LVWDLRIIDKRFKDEQHKPSHQSGG